MQECSRPGTNIGVFLKTPLLHKVRELQKLLLGPTGDKDQAVLGVLTSRQAAPDSHTSLGTLIVLTASHHGCTAGAVHVQLSVLALGPDMQRATRKV